MIKKILFLTLSFICCIATVQAEEIPPDFKLTAVSGGVAPWTPLYKIEIDSEGNGIYFEMPAKKRDKGEFKRKNTFQIDEIDMGFLYDTVTGNNFFGLRKEYIDKGVLDGSFAQLTITAAGKTHTVRAQNIAVERFDNIMIVLNIITPDENKMVYNELLR